MTGEVIQGQVQLGAAPVTFLLCLHVLSLPDAQNIQDVHWIWGKDSKRGFYGNAIEEPPFSEQHLMH